MSYSLLVIDMQGYFKASKQSSVKKNVLKQIELAIQDNAPIVFVEYAGCGSTLPSLKNLPKNNSYSKIYKIKKTADDGSDVIMSTLRSNKLPRKHVRVCGVNTDCCVYETVCGLSRALPKTTIEVVEDACGSTHCHKDGIYDMNKLFNVTII